MSRLSAVAVVFCIVVCMTCGAWAQGGETLPANWIKIKFTENNPQTPYKIYLKHAGGVWTPPNQSSKGYIPSSGEWTVPLNPDVWNAYLHVQYKKGTWHTLAEGYVQTKQTYAFSSDGTYDPIAWYTKVLQFIYKEPTIVRSPSFDTNFTIMGYTRPASNVARTIWLQSHRSDEKSFKYFVQYLLPPEIIEVNIDGRATVYGDMDKKESKQLVYDKITDLNSLNRGTAYYIDTFHSYTNCCKKGSPVFRPANNKWIEVTHKGAYQAKFFVVWKDASGKEKRWESGSQRGTLHGSTGIGWVDTHYRHLVNLDDNVETAFLHAQALDVTGWKTIVARDVPVRRIHEVSGTVVQPKYDVYPPLPAGRPANWIRLVHKGAYVAKFYLQWEGQTKLWQSGNKHAGYAETIPLPPNVKTVLLNAQEHTGANWKTIIRKTDAPVQHTYTISGTTLNPKCDISPPLK